MALAASDSHLEFATQVKCDCESKCRGNARQPAATTRAGRSRSGHEITHEISNFASLRFPQRAWGCPGMERVMGIEPTLAAWEAAVLPLNYTRAGRFDITELQGFLAIRPCGAVRGMDGA